MRLYAKVENNEIIEIFDLHQKYNYISFPTNGPDLDWCIENNLMEVSVGISHDRNTEKLVSATPYINNSKVYTVRVEQLTEEEINNNKNSQWANIRSSRNNMLRETDWTGLVDSPLTLEQKNLWAVYRQALRDITQQQNPFNIQWPSRPNE